MVMITLKNGSQRVNTAKVKTVYAVEVVGGFTSVVLGVVETPTPFLDLTPILNTLVETGTVAVVE